MFIHNNKLNVAALIVFRNTNKCGEKNERKHQFSVIWALFREETCSDDETGFYSRQCELWTIGGSLMMDDP